MKRCAWAKTPLGIAYHDAEWGAPVHDDRVLFEFLVLEGAQAGLVSRFATPEKNRLMNDEAIVRNRLKIESAIGNAKAFLAVQKEFGSFDAYLWRFVGGRPRVNAGRRVPARTPQSDALSRDLLKRGFKLVGSTICYAFMQAVGMVDDHAPDCFRKGSAKRAR